MKSSKAFWAAAGTVSRPCWRPGRRRSRRHRSTPTDPCKLRIIPFGWDLFLAIIPENLQIAAWKAVELTGRSCGALLFQRTLRGPAAMQSQCGPEQFLCFRSLVVLSCQGKSWWNRWRFGKYGFIFVPVVRGWQIYRRLWWVSTISLVKHQQHLPDKHSRFSSGSKWGKRKHQRRRFLAHQVHRQVLGGHWGSLWHCGLLGRRWALKKICGWETANGTKNGTTWNTKTDFVVGLPGKKQTLTFRNSSCWSTWMEIRPMHKDSFRSKIWWICIGW